MPLAEGSRLGPYVISVRIGAGGMGEVWRARDSRLGREVALKVLPDSFAADVERVARFRAEARAASLLNHPNVVTVFDVGQEEGRAWFAMELLEGETLRRLLDAGRPPLRRALQISTQIAEGLAAAHVKGIVHRDLKPEN
ncbi:MAG TPA: serine/threonine-protein kinase, partial [Thermoanaerobaculia bacterium]|nr:serine/threonine-protein kinase [Thermoanaerobaculia bacterium]